MFNTLKKQENDINVKNLTALSALNLVYKIFRDVSPPEVCTSLVSLLTWPRVMETSRLTSLSQERPHLYWLE